MKYQELQNSFGCQHFAEALMEKRKPELCGFTFYIHSLNMHNKGTKSTVDKGQSERANSMSIKNHVSFVQPEIQTSISSY